VYKPQIRTSNASPTGFLRLTVLEQSIPLPFHKSQHGMEFSPLAHWRLELHCHRDLGSLLKQCFESACSKSIVFRSDFGVKPECKLCGLERKVCRFRNANVMGSRHCTVLLFNAVSYNNVVNRRRSQVTTRRRLGKKIGWLASLEREGRHLVGFH
jgi:hypothetical protein